MKLTYEDAKKLLKNWEQKLENGISPSGAIIALETEANNLIVRFKDSVTGSMKVIDADFNIIQHVYDLIEATKTVQRVEDAGIIEKLKLGNHHNEAQWEAWNTALYKAQQALKSATARDAAKKECDSCGNGLSCCRCNAVCMPKLKFLEINGIGMNIENFTDQ